MYSIVVNFTWRISQSTGEQVFDIEHDLSCRYGLRILLDIFYNMMYINFKYERYIVYINYSTSTSILTFFRQQPISDEISWKYSTIIGGRRK